MTQLTTHCDPGSRTTPAPPLLGTAHRRSLPAVLTDPRVRLGAGTAVLLVTAWAARRGRISPAEITAFRAVNGLPDSIHPPAWAIMQLGTLGAAPVAAGMAWLAGERQLASRLLAAGTSTWALSKLVKQMVHRPRRWVPGSWLAGRGPDAAGLGYLSGHAGVAVALGAAALPHLGAAGRSLTLIAIPAVGLTRVYVGAHLPLDVVGGAALGLAVDAAIGLVTGARRHPQETSPHEPTANPGERWSAVLEGARRCGTTPGDAPGL